MCEKIIEKIPSMTAEERLQLRRNCERAAGRSADLLVMQEAKRILGELQTLELREARFLARQPAARRIEYAFRRLPASEGERLAIRMLHERSETPPPGAGPSLETTALRNWHQVLEMCRRRRHLLQPCEDRRGPEHAAAEVDAREDTASEVVEWAAPLLENDDLQRCVRLRPEAVAAFASLGYVAARR